jgi:hypothetical protein
MKHLDPAISRMRWQWIVSRQEDMLIRISHHEENGGPA